MRDQVLLWIPSNGNIFPLSPSNAEANIYIDTLFFSDGFLAVIVGTIEETQTRQTEQAGGEQTVIGNGAGTQFRQIGQTAGAQLFSGAGQFEQKRQTEQAYGGVQNPIAGEAAQTQRRQTARGIGSVKIIIIERMAPNSIGGGGTIEVKTGLQDGFKPNLFRGLGGAKWAFSKKGKKRWPT